MHLKCDSQKALDAAIMLLGQQGREESRMKLSRLFYLADRLALDRHCIVVTTDLPMAGGEGLLAWNTRQGLWEGWSPWVVQDGERYRLQQERDPVRLSLAEKTVLMEVRRRYLHMDERSLERILGSLPEARHAGNRPKLLSYEEILMACGRDRNQAREAAGHLNAVALCERLLGGKL